MRKKKPARKPEKRKPLSAKTRGADERLRGLLRNADIKASDTLVPKAITRLDAMATTRMSRAQRARLKAAGTHGGAVQGFLGLTDADAAKVTKRVRAAGARTKAKKS